MSVGGWWDNAPSRRWGGPNMYLTTTGTVANVTNTVTFPSNLTIGSGTVFTSANGVLIYDPPTPPTPEQIEENRRKYELFQENRMLAELKLAAARFREQQELRAALLAQFHHLYKELE